MKNRDEATLQQINAAGREADQQGVFAEESANEALQQQSTAILSNETSQRYEQGLAETVQAKYEQVDRIEDRLESQIAAQQARLQTLASNRPGLIVRPGARQAWKEQQTQQQQMLQRMQGRLERVRELRDAMSPTGPKIEELAERQFRQRKPQLAEQWDDMRAAQRGHAALMRQKAQEKRRGHSVGQSLAQTLTQEH